LGLTKIRARLRIADIQLGSLLDLGGKFGDGRGCRGILFTKPSTSFVPGAFITGFTVKENSGKWQIFFMA